MEVRTITRKAVTALESLNREFGSLYTRKDVDNKLYELKQAEGKSNYPDLLRDLMDIMDAFGISYEIRTNDTAYYEQLLKDCPFPHYEDILDKMMYTMLKKTDEYASPEQFMKRIVDRMEDPADGWAEDPLRVRILKQFIKYGGCLWDISHKEVSADGKETVKQDIGGRPVIQAYIKEKAGLKTRPKPEDLAEYLDCIQDDIFDVLEGASKELLKPRARFGLLKIVNDLANGYFRVGGSTKKNLYYFAMVYNMTYFSGAGDDENVTVYDASSDIEANLFRDYYVNNLMRYISGEYRDNISKYEADPSGQGINYKNFAEVICLYYLSKDLPATEKLRRSNDMINALAGSTPKAPKKKFRNTETFRSQYVEAQEVLRLSEEDFRRFIREHYDCNTALETYEHNGKKVTNRMNPIQVDTEQNTAWGVYQEILQELKEDYGRNIADCDYGLTFCEPEMLRNEPEEFLAKHPDVTPEQLENYIGLLESVNRFIVAGELHFRSKNDQSGSSSDTDSALSVKGPQDVTRTSVLTAYYYLYNAMNENAVGQWKNFEELFEDFSDGANAYLEEAYYQPLSVKNIFDIMLVFSSYANMNI